MLTYKIIDATFVSSISATTVDALPGLYVSAEITPYNYDKVAATLVTVFTWSQVESDTRLQSPWITDAQKLFAFKLPDDELQSLLESGDYDAYNRTTSVFALLQTLAPANRRNLQQE